jgi:DNA (cytosine-5)-methyltransferase 1
MFTLQSGKQHAIGFNLRGRDDGAMPEMTDAASLRSATGGSSNSYIAFSAKDYGADMGELAPTLRGMGHDLSHANGGGQLAIASSNVPFDAMQLDSSDPESDAPDLLIQGMVVRRLTPRECERLQGFPDDYTLVEYRGKLAADGPRYRALGNSMAVPVMRWIGERIAAVHALLPSSGVPSCECE